MLDAVEANPREVVDLGYRMTGESLPVDHGYALYSAVCAAVPALHGANWLGIHPVDGNPMGEGELRLRRHAVLKLRLPASRISDVLPLAGRRLMVAGHPLRLGPPTVSALQPAKSLDARCVHVRLTEAPRVENGELGRTTLDIPALTKATQCELERQLERMGVAGKITLCGRRTITVSGQRLVGFSVRVSELDDEGSLVVQARGLGGKRAMGCGVFRVTKGAEVRS